MTDTLNRCLALVAPGTGGGSDLTTDLRALASATGFFMVSDTNHLAHENPLRTLFTDRGAVGTKSLYAPAYGGLTVAPDPESINWRPPIDPTGGRTGYFSLRMGSHAIHRAANGIQWPRIQCKLKMLAPSGYSVGVVLCAVRGRNGIPDNRCLYVGDYTTSTSYIDTTLTLALRDEDVTPESVEFAPGYTSSGASPVAENATRNTITLWLGAYCNSNSAAHVASVSGISVYLVDP